MKRQLFILAFTLSFVLIGCSDTKNEDISGPDKTNEILSNPGKIDGTYQYSGYDADGNLLSKGTITLNVKDTVISGSRNLKGIGYESGTGEISGYIDNNNVTINLTPNSIGQFILKGKISNGNLTGDRLLDTGTSIVVRNEGTFKAVIISQ